MTIDEYINQCNEPLSIGLFDKNGTELFVGDNIIFYKRKFVRFGSREEAEENGFDIEGHYSEWYPTGKITRKKGIISFDMRYGYFIDCRSTSPHRYDEEDKRLINIEKTEGEQ